MNCLVKTIQKSALLRQAYRIGNAILIGILILSAISMPAMRPARAAVADWQKGVSLYPQANNDFSKTSFQSSLKNAAAIGANMATFIVPYYQSSDFSTDIQPGWNTPTDSSLIDGINYAHSLGMAATIKIHLSPYYGDSWAAYIDPTNRPQWFEHYGVLLKHYAELSESQKVQQFVIGNELTSLSSETVHPDNTGQWQNLIKLVRSFYQGKVAYNANWGNETDQIAFWNDLDAIGISAYFNLSADKNNSWAEWNRNDIYPLVQRFSKPILFTEIGYRSVDGAAAQPWNFSLPGKVNLQEQAQDYAVFFSYWNNFDYLQGINLWNWETDPNAGGLSDANYTVQNKPAQEVVRTWFSLGKK